MTTWHVDDNGSPNGTGSAASVSVARAGLLASRVAIDPGAQTDTGLQNMQLD
jgi:hypothetical protein